MSTKIDQKKYLKKYLSKSDKKKKHKKKSQISDGIKIIDDDIGLSELTHDEVDVDLFASAEDAPQVVAVIDERPIEMRIREKFELRNRWQEVSEENIKNETSNNNAHYAKEVNVKQNKNITDESVTKNPNDYKQMYTKSGNNIEIDSDNSLPRQKNRKLENDSSCDSDMSPPRKFNRSNSFEENKDKQKFNYDSDASPPRKKNSFQRSESSSLRKTKNDDDMSPPRKYKHNSSPDHSNFSKQNKHQLFKKYDLKQSHSNKLKKTLDGKVAGLQNSHNLKNELIEIKRNENDLFNKLSSDITGVNASPIVRDRKTGRIRDLEKEAAQQKLKEERDNIQKEKYSRWGKGLKQVDDTNEKIQNDLYEMSKPLARYADDVDLENYLKNQEREGDPMLEYIRKEKGSKFDTEKSKKPQYKGSFMPNRFSIPPGYRWDGVDRSNGYEKRWFETINAKKAREEIAYKWSTEDM